MVLDRARRRVGHDGLQRGRDGHRRGRRDHAGEDHHGRRSIPAWACAITRRATSAMGIGLPREQLAPFTQICQALYSCFVSIDASLAEINPLAVLGDGTLHGARRQDGPRRQRPLPPPRPGRDARRGRGDRPRSARLG